jgi:DNA-binding CsgD family transcriptional regulator
LTSSYASAARPSPQRIGRAPAAAASKPRQGRVRAARGDEQARADFQAALELFSTLGLDLEAANARVALARALASHAPGAAVVEARHALGMFERLGATHDADAAAALLRQLGAPARTVPKGYGALTRRETEVLSLLAEGCSNPEIAERLYISRRTAEHHVAHILAKLGLRNRAEAAAHALRELPTSTCSTTLGRSWGDILDALSNATRDGSRVLGTGPRESSRETRRSVARRRRRERATQRRELARPW